MTKKNVFSLTAGLLTLTTMAHAGTATSIPIPETGLAPTTATIRRATPPRPATARELPAAPETARRKKKDRKQADLPRFAVMSDTHFGNNKGEGPMVKVPKALRNLLARAGELDALFICGDITDWGTPEQYELFRKVFDDPTIVPADLPVYVMMGNHDNYAKGAQDNYLVLRQPYHRLIDIKGYPFITTSMDGGGWDDYSAEELIALDANLAEAAKRYPGKPIFVFTHVPPMNTVYGTCKGEGGWGSNVLTPYLKKYPQAVVFGGHSHFPLGDPRSIHQGDFTTINDGSVTYSEVEPGVVNEGIHPDQYENVTEACLVSLDREMNIEIQRWDTYGDEEILPRWRVEAPHDGSRFVYTDARTGGTAPAWAEGSAATVSEVADQTCKVTFPQAQDDENVHHYVIEILSGGNVVARHSIFSGYYLNSRMPKTLTAHVKGLPDGCTMKARVIAYDSYKNASAALESAEFSTPRYVPSPEARKPVANLFDLRFAADGSVRDASSHAVRVKTGSTRPTVVPAAAGSPEAAAFSGSAGCFYRVDYADDEAIRSAFSDGFSYELLYRPGNTANACPLSAQESGGAGIEQASGGQIQFYCHVGGGYKVLKSGVTAEPGRYYHVVAVYDRGAARTRLYVNGIPAGEMAAEGDFGFPADTAARWIGIGGDCNGSGNAQFALKGEVAVARMYGKALTRDEVFLLHQDCQSATSRPAAKR